jgi:hypothetical protein
LRGPRVGGPLGKASDARQDLIGALGPDKRLRVGLMRIDEALNRALSWGILRNVPRRICFIVSSANQRSTRLIQEP